MKRQILLTAALAALVTVSCTKSKLNNPDEMGRILVSASIADGATTKGIVDNTTSLEELAFVHAQLASQASPVPFAGTPFGGTREAGDESEIKFESGKEPMYDRVDGKTSYLMGYSPAVTPASGVVSWTPNGTVDVLVSNVWEAGTYFAPVETGLVFNHQLARVEVAMQSTTADNADAARNTWGKITKIVFKDVITTLSLNHATNAVTVGTAKADFTLLNSNYTIGTTPDPAFTPAEINSPDASAVSAAAMLVPTEGATTFTFVITSEKQPDTEVVATLTAPQTFTKGRLYRVTLTCDAEEKAIKATTTIGAWSDGGTIGSDAPTLPPTIIEYGKGLGAITTGLKGSTTDSYNHLYGETNATNATNGPNRATVDEIYANEKPYVMFEVAKSNVPSTDKNRPTTFFWDDAQGATLGGNICATTYGAGWRLPRASELKLIMLNKTELEKVPGFYPVMDDYYIKELWSATAYNANSHWVAEFSGELTLSSNSAGVRCVREVSDVPVFIEYGKAPYEKTGTDLSGSTAQSYNGWWGTVAGGKNGAYYDAIVETFAKEKPYAKFEIAKNYLPAMTWTAAQGTTENGNICTKTFGIGWRLPRISELQLIYENKEALSNVPGFTPHREDIAYWSATEVSERDAIPLDFQYADIGEGAKTTTCLVRCVREMPLPSGGIPVTIEYGKAPYGKTDGLSGASYSSYNNLYGTGTLTNGPMQATAELAYTNEKPYVKFEVAPTGIPTMPWPAAFGTTLRGSICAQTFGFGWRMPRISELKLIYLNNAELSKNTGFTPMGTSPYGSATEQSLTHAYYWNSNAGLATAFPKRDTGIDIRCIRELPITTLATVLEYGVAPYGDITTDLVGGAYQSYNDLYGSGITNGGYIVDGGSIIYSIERPYVKFEVAKTDISTKMTWTAAQGAGPGGNVCANTFGPAWRLPRLAELKLIYNNRADLSTAAGFVPLSSVNGNAVYWSATEFTAAEGRILRFDNGATDAPAKSQEYLVRCVKEIPTPLPSTSPLVIIGDPPYDGESRWGKLTSQLKAASVYNSWYGDVAGGHNGSYRASQLAFIAEVPYYKYEVAKSDVKYGTTNMMPWAIAQGGQIPHSNICARTMGNEWRLPRVSEFVVMTMGAITSPGFEAFNDDGIYGTATEYSSTEAYAGRGANIAKVNPVEAPNGLRVRCIRELPPMSTPPVILTFGEAPYFVKNGISTATTTSYNSWYGAVTGGHNGVIYADIEAAIAGEPPYHKFEIAKYDILSQMTWTQAQGTTKGGNICAKTFGSQWRIPRVSELMLIYMNTADKAIPGAVSLDKADGFTPIIRSEEGWYWSATEAIGGSGDDAMIMVTENGGDQNTWMLMPAPKIIWGATVRCIREIP